MAARGSNHRRRRLGFFDTISDVVDTVSNAAASTLVMQSAAQYVESKICLMLVLVRVMQSEMQSARQSAESKTFLMMEIATMMNLLAMSFVAFNLKTIKPIRSLREKMSLL